MGLLQCWTTKKMTLSLKNKKNEKPKLFVTFCPIWCIEKVGKFDFHKKFGAKNRFPQKVAICLSFFIILFCNFTAQTFLICHLLKYLSAKLFFLDERSFIQLLLSVILPNYILYLNTCFVHVFSKIYLLLFICNIYRVFIDLFSNFFPELLPV